MVNPSAAAAPQFGSLVTVTFGSGCAKEGNGGEAMGRPRSMPMNQRRVVLGVIVRPSRGTGHASSSINKMPLACERRQSSGAAMLSCSLAGKIPYTRLRYRYSCMKA